MSKLATPHVTEKMIPAFTASVRLPGGGDTVTAEVRDADRGRLELLTNINSYHPPRTQVSVTRTEARCLLVALQAALLADDDN